MPYRPKIVTRDISASTVSADLTPKGSGLTNGQMDSNFLNLRDASIGIAADDSTVIDIGMGNTLKIAGSGTVTTAVSGQTLTITGTGGGGGASTGDLTITGTTISAGTTNADITITSSGTGNINLDADTVRVGDSATNAIITTNGAGDLILSTNDNTSTASIRIYDGNPGLVELTSFGGANINLNAGVGRIAIGSGSAEPGGITTQLTYDLHLNTNNGTDTANITIENNAGGGTGQIHLNPYGSDDYVFIGSGGKDGTGIARIRGGTGLYLRENSNDQEITMNYEGGTIIDTKDSGYLYIKAGTRYLGANTSVESASDPTVTIDASKTTVTSVILTADAQIRIINFANVPGAFHRIYLQQDTTGGRTASFSITDSTAIKWPYGPPVLSTDAYAIDMVELHSFDNSGPGGEQYEAVGVFTKGFTASYGPVDTVSYNNQNIRLLPDGSGNVILDLHTWPNTDGSNGQVLTTNGSGILSWTTASSAQGMTFVGDDSTGTRVSDNETFKIAGTQNITTAVSGDTLTITGPNLSSYLTNSPITIVGDDSTGTTLNTGETIKIAGGTGITTAVSGDVLTITATGGGTGEITITGNKISTTSSDANLELDAAGMGTIQLKANLDLNDNVITSSTGGLNVKIDKNIVLSKTSATAITTTSTNALKLGSGGDGSGNPGIGIGYDHYNATNTNDISFNMVSTGRLRVVDQNSTQTKTTIGSNGAASALTANPVGYLKIKINDTEYQVPYYNV